jgi:aspartate/tyrosine/aromatic aminotransferase
LFQNIHRLNPDAILGLMAQYRADPFPGKVDLGVGVYRDLSGNTPVLESVRRAEQAVLRGQVTKSYVAAAGREEYNTAVEAMVLGEAHPARRARRARTAQTPGGCGALRVGAELLKAAAPGITVHVSDPTWPNHPSLLGNSGLKLERYPYYDAAAHELRFEAMLDRLHQAPAGDVVLLHVSCHNPTGADLSLDQWKRLTKLLGEKRLTPFLDLAYQGFGAGLDEDVAGLRLLTETLPEALIAVSHSKNLGLYRERVGAIITVSENESRADAVQSHVLQIARSIYSMPPDHGAAIAAHIFADAALKESWLAELGAMRGRIESMRALLSGALKRITGTGEYDFIQSQRGMFSLLGLSGAQVDTLRNEDHIYMLGDSRINLAGVMPQNVEYVAQAIASQR